MAPSSSIIAASTERSASSAWGGVSAGGPPEPPVAYSVMVSILPTRTPRVGSGMSVGEVLLREPLQVLPHRTLGAGTAQAVRRVVGDDELGAAPTIRAAAHAADSALELQQQLGGELAEAGDDARLECFELAHEIGRAGRDLVRQRVSVFRGPALQDVRDVHGLARKP